MFSSAPGLTEKKAQGMTSIKKKAVVLFSGGIDSSTTLALAASEDYELYVLSFDYNQRHVQELESAKKVIQSFETKKHLIIKFDLSEIGGSALTSNIAVPKKSCGAPENVSIPVTYVPARNTVFLSFALAWAEVLGAEDIFIGANAVDYSGYPDCRPEYLKAFGSMANLATKASVEGKMKFRINAPLMNMTKAEIIQKGLQLGLDYGLTWSCYDPQQRQIPSSELQVPSNEKEKHKGIRTKKVQIVPCNRCDSCVLRARGFKEAGAQDPLLSR